MKINIITSDLKKANRNLNISLLISTFFTLLFFISFWLPKNGTAKNLYLISLFASISFTLFSIVLVIIRQSKKKTITVDKTQIIELTINTQNSFEKISKASEIEYAGNEVRTNSDSKVYEIDNKSAFQLLKNGYEIPTKNQVKTSNQFDMSPKELFNTLMSTLWAAS